VMKSAYVVEPTVTRMRLNYRALCDESWKGGKIFPSSK
jgi:hypothetical protein